VTAVIARQFEPTRIERQLLAQTFDLVCQQTIVERDVSANSSAAIERTTRIDNAPSLHAGGAGRRAA
jgi:hypothetical protein